MLHPQANPFSRYLLACFGVLLISASAIAQTEEENTPNEESGEGLAVSQARLADRYDQLELLAGRLAELSGATQPRRARLLRELVTKSRERDIAGRFDVIISDLQNDSLGKASTAQKDLHADLKKMLELLEQEDRDRQIDSERKRVQKYLAEVKRLIQLQRGIKARTDGGDDAPKLTDDQKRLSKATGDLEKEIKSTEGTKSEKNGADSESGKQSEGSKPSEGSNEKPSSDENSSEGKPEDKPSSSEQPDEGQQTPNTDPKRQESPSQPKEGQHGSDSPPSESPSSPSESQSQGESQSQPSQSQPSQSQPSESSPQSEQPQNPAERAQQRLKKAQQRMQQALEELEEAKRDQAVDRQEKALRELEQAKAELERILRQLREEEMERTLVLLEARFRKMLDAQVAIYEQTKKLDSNQLKLPQHEIEISSGRLSRQERQIVREADRALVLLREDGTTVAFPEAVEQARDDMQSVVKRLADVKLGVITLGLEEDIITALEETLAALQQALKEAREKKSQPQQGQQGQPGEQSLVDQIAELRMIRALQNRINRRTARYGEILGDQPAIEADLLEALDELAIRQERIFRATRDLDSGRNR